MNGSSTNGTAANTTTNISPHPSCSNVWTPNHIFTVSVANSFSRAQLDLHPNLSGYPQSQRSSTSRSTHPLTTSHSCTQLSLVSSFLAWRLSGQDVWSVLNTTVGIRIGDCEGIPYGGLYNPGLLKGTFPCILLANELRLKIFHFKCLRH